MTEAAAKTMTRGTVRLEKHAAVGTIILDRPAAYNAMNLELMMDLAEAVEQARWDNQLRAVMVTGEGKAFCAGGDVKGMLEHLDSGAHLYLQELTKHLHLVITGIREMPKPVIAAVNGIAAGAGLSLMLACDLVIAAEDARFDTAYLRLALVPDGGCTYFLVRHLGPKRTMELIVSGKTLRANEALQAGLVNRLASPDSLFKEALAWAEELTQGPSTAIALAKRLLHAAADQPLEQVIEQERRAIIHSATTADFLEGAMAFREKRKPFFK